MIGDPVTFSIAHIYYPELFTEFEIQGSFEKIKVSAEKLGAFFNTPPPLDFITVTMPHKIEVMKYCDKLSKDAQSIGSVNFISIHQGILEGRNYDGIAALNAIEAYKPVHLAHVVVFGTGGAGRAAIYEAKKRGAFVTVCNRTKETGSKVADEFNVPFSKQIPQSFDVLINATSVGMDGSKDHCIIDRAVSLDGVIVLDMASRNGECYLKKITEETTGTYIPGKVMFKLLTRESLIDYTKTCLMLTSP